jgi:peroxiredoxin
VANSSSAFTPSRVTVILNAQGEVEAVYNPVSNIGDHPGEVLSDCQTLFGGN